MITCYAGGRLLIGLGAILTTRIKDQNSSRDRADQYLLFDVTNFFYDPAVFF